MFLLPVWKQVNYTLIYDQSPVFFCICYSKIPSQNLSPAQVCTLDLGEVFVGEEGDAEVNEDL